MLNSNSATMPRDFNPSQLLSPTPHWVTLSHTPALSDTPTMLLWKNFAQLSCAASADRLMYSLTHAAPQQLNLLCAAAESLTLVARLQQLNLWCASAEILMCSSCIFDWRWLPDCSSWIFDMQQLKFWCASAETLTDTGCPTAAAESLMRIGWNLACLAFGIQLPSGQFALWYLAPGFPFFYLFNW